MSAKYGWRYHVWKRTRDRRRARKPLDVKAWSTALMREALKRTWATGFSGNAVEVRS